MPPVTRAPLRSNISGLARGPPKTEEVLIDISRFGLNDYVRNTLVGNTPSSGFGGGPAGIIKWDEKGVTLEVLSGGCFPVPILGPSTISWSELETLSQSGKKVPVGPFLLTDGTAKKLQMLKSIVYEGTKSIGFRPTLPSPKMIAKNPHAEEEYPEAARRWEEQDARIKAQAIAVREVLTPIPQPSEEKMVSAGAERYLFLRYKAGNRPKLKQLDDIATKRGMPLLTDKKILKIRADGTAWTAFEGEIKVDERAYVSSPGVEMGGGLAILYHDEEGLNVYELDRGKHDPDHTVSMLILEVGSEASTPT